jgi:acyl-CoA thioester hydrolase
MSVPLNSKIIIKDWIDYNGHMNLSYYILVFDMGAEVILSKFKMGEQAAKTTKRSTMVVETHTNYIKEVRESDEVIISLSHIDHDKKRLHYKLEMYEKSKNILSATTEVLALYINLDERKVSEFENEKIKIMNDYIFKNNINFNQKDLKFSSKLKK